ncbi:MAG: hypothetical protein PHC46_04445 [Clostridia bacterium]|nr:hypothetical protein [Clostridia bacterium]
MKSKYYHYLDRKSRHIAYKLAENKNVTNLILDYANELYKSADSYKSTFREKNFDAGYHEPISSDFEFLIARILINYSNINDLNWKIYLRKQTNKCTPDIRIEKKDKTIAIIEIKAKAGWMRPFFSKQVYDEDKTKHNNGTEFNPKKLVKDVQKQLMKYKTHFRLSSQQVYLLLPTMVLAHKKSSNESIEDHRVFFAKNSKLPKENLILLSSNPMLSLNKTKLIRKDYLPTKDFEKMVRSIEKL